MKFECRCGATIHDITDSIPNKAHIIPDQVWFDMLDAIDAAIEKSGPSATDKEASCMRIRTLLGSIARTAYQCTLCGRVYIEDRRRELKEFRPHPDGTASELFQIRES